MQIGNNILKVILLIIFAVILAFNVLLYNFCEKQKAEIDATVKQLQLQVQVTGNQFKYEQDQIEHLGHDLENARQQIKDQKDASIQDNKSAQTALVDIKAETDAIKVEMKGWQKDYVSVLAQLEKKMDDSQAEIKSFENNLAALNIPELKNSIDSLKADVEKINHPADNSLTSPPPTPDNKIERTELQSQ